MSRIDRRRFVKRSVVGIGVPLAVGAHARRVLGANERIHVAVAGINGRGGGHITSLLALDGVEISYLVDPDSRIFEARLKSIGARGGPAPKCVQDIRKALEDKSLDAVSIATCNHWHSLITIWACQAGKDVYVEKPLSHNVHEGRIAVETARKYKRVVQYGTGAGSLGDGIAALAEKGTYGKLLVSRGLCYKARGSIGFQKPAEPPAGLDFDIWTGPAPKQPYHANLVHYKWHWFWDFGNGDIGNQGSHQIHAALHAIPGATFPKSVISVGGRFGYQDQGQTANTQIAVFDFGPSQLLFEVRGLKTGKYFDQGVGNTFHFTEGVVAGGKFFRNGSKEGEPVARAAARRVSRGANFPEFIRCMRVRDTELLMWNIETAHYSSALCHLANISYRLGHEVPFTEKPTALGDNEHVLASVKSIEDQLVGALGMDLKKFKYTLGTKVKFCPKAEKFIDNPAADKFLTRAPRPPFCVPEKV